MEPDSNLSGGMYSGIGSGLLGLEMPLHPQQQPSNPQASQNPQSLLLHPQNHQLAAFGGDHTPQAQQSGKQSYAFASKPKPTSPNSDEDEAGDDGAGDPKRKMSPWHRMKWTDNMVRLLIMAVYYIGDEVGSEASDPAAAKKKAGGLLQKKGKWKSVSRAMMEKGFYVSPQQCEDKFNDLNKRYKRVNDIIGRGTACRVVENQSLLETMDISPKMKEEARKLLNSKHLFFREMCAYHNSCGHGTPPTGPASSHSTEMAASEPSHVLQQQQQQQAQQPLCYHSSDNSQMAVNSCRNEGEGLKLIKAGSDEEDDESEDDEEDEAEEEAAESGGHGQEDEENSSCKRQRKGSASPLMAQLSAEVGSMMQDGSKSRWEKRHWVEMRLIQLEEQRVKYQYQALELEKQWLKWIKFSSKKEREIEKAKLENQRRRLETERMVLLVRHKEMELQDQHQTHNRRPLQDRIDT